MLIECLFMVSFMWKRPGGRHPPGRGQSCRCYWAVIVYDPTFGQTELVHEPTDGLLTFT